MQSPAASTADLTPWRAPVGTRSVSRLAGLALLLCLQACGGATLAPAEPQTSDLSELERRLDQHQSELEARFGSLEPEPEAEVPASASPDAPEEPRGSGMVSPEPPSPSAGGEYASDEEPADREELSACNVGCQALEGMRRAASRICEISGATSPQCARARDRVGRADERVSRSGCGC